MFTRQLNPDEKIPILNKPPAAPQPSAANEARLAMQRNLADNKNKRRLRSRLVPGHHKCDLEIPFKVFEHFIISKKPIRELNCGVHIVFFENFAKLPPFGISCISHLDLWKDEVEADIQEFKQFTDSKLKIFKIIPYKHNVTDIPQPEYDRIIPRKNEALGISFQQNIIVDDNQENSKDADALNKNKQQLIVNGLKICFEFTSQPPTNWFFVRYPQFVNDFSINGAIKVFTTSGYLEWQRQRLNMEQECEQPINPIHSMPNAHMQDLMMEDVKECHICMEDGQFVLLYPCGHYNTHEHCLLKKEKKENLNELIDNYICALCNKIVTKFIHLRFSGTICNFCPSRKCTKFDSYYYPCGCSLGCMKGLLDKLERRELSPNCKQCNKIVEIPHYIYS